jgi:tripartite-type tricarboxylate transporter receptor subunit TctC
VAPVRQKSTSTVFPPYISNWPHPFPKAPFNVEKDLTGVGLINYGPQIIVGHKTLAQNSVAELAAWMKQPGGRAKFGHSGPGSSPHICAVMFAAAIGAQIELIPYRGGAPAMSDLISGHLDLFCTNLAGEHVKAGTVKAYGVLSQQRLSTFPDVPSLVQLGYSELDIRVWQGMFAPSATPTPILEKLNAALRVALADPKVIKRFEQTDFFVFPSVSDEQTIPAANALLHDEIVRWGQVIRANNIEGAP